MSVYRADLYFRWYCVIIPRLGVGAMGGFEFSTGGYELDSLHTYPGYRTVATGYTYCIPILATASDPIRTSLKLTRPMTILSDYT
jgi:hypothetical protein